MSIDRDLGLRRMRRPPTHPGKIFVEEYLKPTAVSQTTAAHAMGMSVNRLNDLVCGKRKLTAENALKLAAFTDTSAAFWLSLQMNRDLWHAMKGER